MYLLHRFSAGWAIAGGGSDATARLLDNKLERDTALWAKLPKELNSKPLD